MDDLYLIFRVDYDSEGNNVYKGNLVKSTIDKKEFERFCKIYNLHSYNQNDCYYKDDLNYNEYWYDDYDEKTDKVNYEFIVIKTQILLDI